MKENSYSVQGTDVTIQKREFKSAQDTKATTQGKIILKVHEKLTK